jgi:hypothetical protein
MAISPMMYHFTTARSACGALVDGLVPAVTNGDDVQEAGVWLSPNLYLPGSYFGAIGLRVEAGQHRPFATARRLLQLEVELTACRPSCSTHF